MDETCKMYVYQYLISGVLSLFVSAYIVIKRPKTLALRSLLLFGLVVSSWGFATFLNKTAPNLAMATIFFKITILTSHLGFPFYLLTVLSIREKRNIKTLMLIFIPAVIQIFIMLSQNYFDNYEVFRTESGWSYRVVSFRPQIILVSVIFLAYLVEIFIVLLSLIRKTRHPLLRRKYTILLVSFTLFQAVGTTLANALTALSLLDPNFRIGGILQFLTFLSIWYVLSLKEAKVPSPSVKEEDFSQVYSSFLTTFYNSVISSQLGEEAFKFTEFIKRSGIENRVLFERNKVVFKGAEDLDIAELIRRNLKLFEEMPIDQEIVDHYLRVLNSADKMGLGWRLDILVKENEEFLKKSDLLYGISGGRFLRKIVEDRSLEGLDDIDACLKIYKRILLTVVGKIKEKDEFRERLSRYYIAQSMEITNYDEVSMKGVKDYVLKISEDQRLSLIIESFNSILSWVYGRVLSDVEEDIDEVLSGLRLVLTLNKDRAVDLGVYPTLLGTLTTKIPKAQVHKLYSDYLEELVEERTRELREAQESLIQSQRLAAIGEAAAMVGHDLRNPLQAIVNMLYLAKMKLRSSPNRDLEEILETIRSQVEYMNKIVSDLQDYARPLKPTLVETSLNQIISDVLSTIKIPENVKISVEIGKDYPKLIVDPSFMKRILTNLVTNAIQAMPNGGRLTITASETPEYALISVQDTGVGIPEEHQSKIFQPLFTTKSKGQGLGLPVCKRLVEALGGSITFESEVGKGSTFTIKIPLKPKVSTEQGYASKIPEEIQKFYRRFEPQEAYIPSSK